MKMSKRAEKALRASIKHWKVDILENGEFPDTSNCPLCKEFMDWTLSSSCSKCIFNKKDIICSNLYQEYVLEYSGSENTPEMKKIARKIIRKMKSLLPKEGELKDGR